VYVILIVLYIYRGVCVCVMYVYRGVCVCVIYRGRERMCVCIYVCI